MYKYDDIYIHTLACCAILNHLYYVFIIKGLSQINTFILIHNIYIYMPYIVEMNIVITGVDRWGTGGTRPPPHFSGWGDSIGIVPPIFLFRKIARHVA